MSSTEQQGHRISSDYVWWQHYINSSQFEIYGHNYDNDDNDNNTNNNEHYMIESLITMHTFPCFENIEQSL